MLPFSGSLSIVSSKQQVINRAFGPHSDDPNFDVIKKSSSMQPQFLRAVFILLMSVLVMDSFAQAPQQFNYQAVIRDKQGQPMINKTIQLRLRIRNGGANGAAHYTEVRTVTTNEFGLITVAVNSPGADSQQGSIGLVDWGNGTKFLQVEVDHDSYQEHE
jgi:hypothetical protein